MRDGLCWLRVLPAFLWSELARTASSCRHCWNSFRTRPKGQKAKSLLSSEETSSNASQHLFRFLPWLRLRPKLCTTYWQTLRSLFDDNLAEPFSTHMVPGHAEWPGVSMFIPCPLLLATPQTSRFCSERQTVFALPRGQRSCSPEGIVAGTKRCVITPPGKPCTVPEAARCNMSNLRRYCARGLGRVVGCSTRHWLGEALRLEGMLA